MWIENVDGNVYDGGGQVIGGLDKNIVVKNAKNIVIKNYVLSVGDLNGSSAVGMDIRQSSNVLIQDCIFRAGVNLEAFKYAYGIRAGYSNDPTQSVDGLRVVDCTFESFGPPSSDYSRFNRDNFCAELGCENVDLIRNKFLGATDANTDLKCDSYHEDNVYQNAYRNIRLHGGFVATVKGGTISGDKPIWFYVPTGKLVLVGGVYNNEQIDVSTVIPTDGAGIVEFELDAPVEIPSDVYDYIQVKDNASSDRVDKKRAEGWVLVGDPVQYVHSEVRYEALMKRLKDF